jgi:hypothetical protein
MWFVILLSCFLRNIISTRNKKETKTMKKALLTFIGLVLVSANAFANTYTASVDVIESQSVGSTSEAVFVVDGENVVDASNSTFVVSGSEENAMAVNVTAGEASEGLAVSNITVAQNGDVFSVGSDLTVAGVAANASEQFVTYNVSVIFE